MEACAHDAPRPMASRHGFIAPRYAMLRVIVPPAARRRDVDDGRRAGYASATDRLPPTLTMDRRELLRAAGAATALALFPHDAAAIWSRVASRALPAPAAGLSDAELALVGAIADTILPRTDTPSATDVGVPAFVDVIVSERDEPDARAAFVAGLAAIDARANAAKSASFRDLSSDARADVIASIEALDDRHAEPARTYWRLKGLVVHGYFTSEVVSKRVLHVQIAPGRFDGSAPMPPRRAATNQPGGLVHD